MGWHSASAGLDVVLVLIILTIFIIICRLMLVFDWRNLKKTYFTFFAWLLPFF